MLQGVRVAYHAALCLQEGAVLGGGGGQLGGGLVSRRPGKALGQLILQLVDAMLQESLFFLTFVSHLRRREA